MRFNRLLFVIALAGLYGCSDKEDVNSGGENTSLIEKASDMSGDLAGKVKQGVSEAGEAASASLDKATEKVGEAVDSVKQASSEAVESVVDASKSLTGPVSGEAIGESKVVEESGQLVGNEVQVQTDAASRDLVAVMDSGQETIDQASVDTAEVQNAMPSTVETAGLEAVGVKDGLDPGLVEIGKTVYSKNCMACHSAGVAGAPKISDIAVWEPRIAKGMDTLNDHAINGFKGSNGFMPAKGGFTTLNDDEVKAAVAYMVSTASK